MNSAHEKDSGSSAKADSTQSKEKNGANAVDQNETDSADVAVDGRSVRAESLIKSHAMLSMAAGLVPIPVVDVVAMVTNQIKMTHGLAEIYDVPFSENRVRSMVISLVGGGAPLASVAALSAAKIIPGVGSLIGSGGVSLLGGATTYGVGRVFAQHFESGGDLLNIDMDKLRDRFRREVKNAEVEAKAEVKAAA